MDKLYLKQTLQTLENNIGVAIDADHAYGSQCTDIIKFFTQLLIGRLVRAGGGAKDFWTSTDPFFTQMCERIDYKNMVEWKKGDIIIWNKYKGNPYGHTAIVAENAPITALPITYGQNGFDKNTTLTKGPTIMASKMNVCLGVYRIKDKYLKNPRMKELIAKNKGSVGAGTGLLASPAYIDETEIVIHQLAPTGIFGFTPDQIAMFLVIAVIPWLVGIILKNKDKLIRDVEKLTGLDLS